MIPEIFTQGIREILILNRKEDTCYFRKIARTPANYEMHIHQAIDKIELMNDPQERLYMSINSRSLRQAIWQFKHAQIDRDGEPSGILTDWYLDTSKHFRHILMQPAQRETKFMLIDIDTKFGRTQSDVETTLNEHMIQILAAYDTPNGYHFVTQPFNPHLVQWMESVEVKSDALMLLYADGQETFRECHD